MMRLDLLLFGSPVQLTVKRLDCRFEDLEEAMKTAWDTHRADRDGIQADKLPSR